jgi:hypothetical protein
MQSQWQTLLEDLWPSRSVPRDLLWRREALLFIAIALAISLAAGPEILAAMELTTLLELLGATLFMTAFAAGAKLALMGLWNAIGRLVLPAPQLVIFRSGASVPARAAALIYVTAHATWCLAFVHIIGAWGHYMIRLAYEA